MKINFPKIVREIDLEEYAPEMAGQKISVWVNPPSADLVTIGEKYKASVDEQNEDKEKDEKEYLNLMSILLSQGSEKTRISTDDLKELQTSTAATDPAFWVWLQNRVIIEINDHRLGRKKA